MGKVTFSVSARTAKLIGQENFATAEGAIVELVKNSYDADARNCIIIFQNHNKDDESLYIIDNGVGMTSEIIEQQWMKIGTDDKLQNFETLGGRVKTGAKGIGRFALDRLGICSELITVSKASHEGSIWSVKWSDFDKEGISINEVEADLNTVYELNLKNVLLEQFASFNSIIELIENTNFDSGTILKIAPLKDQWEENSLQSLFDNLEVLIPPQEQPEFDIHLFSTNLPEEYGKVNTAYYDDYDYKVKAKYLGDTNHTINFIITRNELNVSELETNYKQVFESEMMKEFPYTLNTFKEKTFEFSKTINELSGFSRSIDQSLLNQIGKFDFTFYFLKNTLADDKKDGNPKTKYPYLNISSANRRAWLKKFGGIKIFRDDFRVRPYGENGQDWLGIGDRQIKSPGGPGQKLGGYRIGSNQIAGTVKISRIANASFQDKSGREGIIENDAFELFKNILIEIIAVFERDRNIVMYNLSELAKKIFKDEEEKRIAQEEADRILKEEADRILKEQELLKNTGNSNLSKTGTTNDNPGETTVNKNTNTEIILAKATKIYEQELEDKNEEIKLLRGLASVGLIISSFAHELKGLRSRLIPRTDFLTKELSKYISKESLKIINIEDNPFYMIQLIKDEDLKLKHWLDYSLSTLKRDKRTRTDINIGEYFERFENTWKRALVQREVTLILKGSKDAKNIIRAFEVDLDTVFNNILSNTLSAFKEKKGNYKREVTIDWTSSGELIEITFTDNGCGLASEYVSDPNRIFEFNETSKRDKKGNKIGTGMGLYIVKLVMADYNGAGIKILPISDGFSINISLPKIK